MKKIKCVLLVLLLVISVHVNAFAWKQELLIGATESYTIKELQDSGTLVQVRIDSMKRYEGDFDPNEYWWINLSVEKNLYGDAIHEKELRLLQWLYPEEEFKEGEQCLLFLEKNDIESKKMILLV